MSIRIALIAVILTLPLLLVSVPRVQAQRLPGPWFEVTPRSVTLGPSPSVGKEFMIGVNITGLEENWHLVGFQLELFYDPELLQVVNITEGPFLQNPIWNLYGTLFMSGDTGTNVWAVGIIFDSGSGYDQTTFPNGNGTVAYVAFRAIKQDKLHTLECSLTLAVYGSSWAVDKDGNVIQIDEAENVDGEYTMWPLSCAVGGSALDISGLELISPCLQLFASYLLIAAAVGAVGVIKKRKREH